ncbi:MAG: LysR family transcriptional regulator [Alphaproteobacteria bacterium]|nr:LysR family transcriptional regulator [Alphaproteobacteria bacterium]
MNLRNLKTFVTVAEYGTVSKAATLLHITQPALSRQITSLELELGFKLFERAGRRLALTRGGEQLLGEARSVLAGAAALRERAQALRRGDIQMLRIAGSALTIEAIIPEFLHRFAELVPGVRLVPIEADSPRHLDMLERGEVHLAINPINVLPFDDRHFASYLLQRFHLMAACARSFALEQAETIDIGALVQHPLLLLGSRYSTRNLFDAACQLANVRPNTAFESGAVHTLLRLAEEGHGVAVIPSILRTDRNKIRTLVVTHRQQPLQLMLASLWDRRRMDSRAAEGFSEMIAEYLQETFPLVQPTKTKAADAPEIVAMQPPARTRQA